MESDMKHQAFRKSSGRTASKGFPNAIDVWIGARIRARRTIVGISQEQLADQIGLTFQQVQKYERGGNRVSASRMVDLAEALGTTPAYFFENMPADIRNQSPAHIIGLTPKTKVEIEKDPVATRENLEFIRLFIKLPQAARSHFRNAIRAIVNVED
jgi:transcriptional regulator with XRE-family HTH domain